MFTQHDILVKANLGITIKAALCRQSVLIWNAIQEMVLEAGNRFVSDTHPSGADLLVVTDHDHLLGNVEQKKALNAQLAGFVNNHDIVTFRCHVYHFGDQIPRHDPHRNSVTTLIHILAGFFAKAHQFG